MIDRNEYLRKIDEVIAEGPYSDNWESLTQHETPRWFRKAKFGIFIHFGVYSVPAFNNEWYPRNMYIQGTPEFEHHVATYGPHKEFGYKDFIPMFKAEKFSAKEWIDLFEAAGAKYVIPVAEHHDGFQMYRSELSHWNAVEMGPHRDILGELTEEAEKHGMVNGASTHRIEHWFFLGHGQEFDSDIPDNCKPGDLYWPSHVISDMHDLYSTPAPTPDYLEDWMMRTCEIIDRYFPKELYFDWWIQHSAAKPYLKKIAAYYYNTAAAKGEEVTIAYKNDSFMYGAATVDMERGQFADAQPNPWQTDTAIARNSWCWTEQNVFKSAKSILCDLVDIVSKNGNLLLNVGPKSDGTISDEDRAVLLGIGDWLKVNGEAIYDTNVWKIASEGPTAVQGGMFTDAKDKVFTKEDFRFTCKGSCVYAACLAYPEDGCVTVKTFAEKNGAESPVFNGVIASVDILGSDEKPEWTRDAEGMHIKTKTVHSDCPVVFRIRMA